MCPVSDFQALTGTSKYHGVFANNIAAANGTETDSLSMPLAGDTLTTIARYLTEVSAETIGDDFTHAYGCP